MQAWVDATAGVAGDMLLAALVDAGAPLLRLQAAVDAVAPDAVWLEARTVHRAGMRATKVDVRVLQAEPPHRNWASVRQLLESAPLEARVRELALRVFARLAEAEARVHGVRSEDVHFHEVGALDSIADVVGVCAALDALDITTLSVSAVAVGSGRVHRQHGELPVPVPAVLEMSAGWAVTGGGDGELATPTGMALVTELAERSESLPPLAVAAVGVGAGTRDTPGRPNVVRVVLGDGLDATFEAAGQEIVTAKWVLETNVDDLDPRIWPTVLQQLLQAGAADAWLVPIVMKKGRPAHTLAVLTDAEHRVALRQLVFTLTSSIGVRETEVERFALARDWTTVRVDSNDVRIKVAHRDGRIVHATPEFDDVVAAAAASSRPVRQLLEQAVAAAESAGLTAGAAFPGDQPAAI
jgi:hypothetical protein